LEGSLNKIIAYEQGLSVVACWGVSPYSHEDDAARAVFAAINIQKKLNRLAKALGSVEFDLPIHIGVSTGSAFMGIIGNEGGRKEIVILGEAVERAYLYMQAAMKVYGKIYVDFETKKEASLFIDFNYIEHVEFANKYTNQPLFEPLDS
jgi:class 3 adenylate cyclase